VADVPILSPESRFDSGPLRKKAIGGNADGFCLESK